MTEEIVPVANLGNTERLCIYVEKRRLKTDGEGRRCTDTVDSVIT